ncbi:hypothetical protein V6Z11_A09G182700 [Gossypium hirsutum]|uniref:Kinesin motor domain-containing protein n=1 Tax=Gossypium darwinii TaxID=34276 RepID=A0A5D2FCJ2_GOSDA|nr:hypothetical protein ES288_A09G187600v1 [Gossypium darwinii]
MFAFGATGSGKAYNICRPWPRPFCEWLKCLRPCAQVCLYAKVEVSELRFS